MMSRKQCGYTGELSEQRVCIVEPLAFYFGVRNRHEQHCSAYVLMSDPLLLSCDSSYFYRMSFSGQTDSENDLLVVGLGIG